MQRLACVCPPAYMLVFVCLLVTVAVEWFHEGDIEMIFFSPLGVFCANGKKVVTVLSQVLLAKICVVC